MPPVVGGVKLTFRRIALALGAIALLVVLIWFRHWIDLPALNARAKELPAWGVLGCLFLLPLVGVPVSVLHALTGAKFGLALGLPLVALSIAFQVAASYAVVHLAPNFFERRFAWLHEKLPPATHRSLTLFTMLLPGAPYFAQNYVLALAEVPFGIFFGYSVPIHIARSLIGLIFGEWSDHPTPARIAVFVCYFLGITVGCGLAFRRLRAQVHSRPRAANGRKRRVTAGRVAR
jgi:uncharacterized membrane protein YdjX (TVP38/TMEM64 family)